jgi:polyphosphate kinase 2 (PPK2 family)
MPGKKLRLKDCDLSAKVSDRDAYEEELADLQQDLFRRQIRLWQKGQRAIVVFEGWDAGGKGGVIRRLTYEMDPRGFKVWPIGPPKDEEPRYPFLWRFWKRLPDRGEVAIFDRSWYGRVLVERVEAFASEKEWARAYDEINEFETMLTADGIRLAKFFLHISSREQLRRFRARGTDPLKQYKLTRDDWRNRGKRKAYERAIQEMLDRTHRKDAPWHVVPAEDKSFARLTVLRACRALLK